MPPSTVVHRAESQSWPDCELSLLSFHMLSGRTWMTPVVLTGSAPILPPHIGCLRSDGKGGCRWSVMSAGVPECVISGCVCFSEPGGDGMIQAGAA